MALKITRNNNGLNNALRGAERGLNNGMQFGLQARRQAKDEEYLAFHTQQALRRAQQIDADIQRENAGRAASAEGIGEMARMEGGDPSQALDAGMRSGSPAVAAAVGGAHQDIWARVGPIAQRMAKSGDTRGAEYLLNDVRDRLKEKSKEQHRTRIGDKIERSEREGAFRTDPDLAGWLGEEEIAEGDAAVSEGFSKLHGMLADPDSDPAAIEHEFGSMQKGRILAEGRSKGRLNTFNDLKTMRETAAAAGPMSPAQTRKVDTMLAAFRMSPELYDDPKGMLAFQQQYRDALEGYTTLGGERIRIEDEDTMRRVMVEREQLRNKLLQAQTASEQSQGRAYDATAQARLNPKTLTPAQSGEMTQQDRLSLALKYRQAADDPDTSAAQAKQYRAKADEIEGGGGGQAPGKLNLNLPVFDSEAPEVPDAAIGTAIEELRKITDPAEREAAMRKKAKELAGGR